MPVWLIPALKAILPHVGTVISAAAPAFTKKRADAVANQTTLLQQQITELQTAASENNAHIKELATQIQNTVEILEKGALLAEMRHRRVLFLCFAATVLSLIAVGATLYILVTR